MWEAFAALGGLALTVVVWWISGSTLRTKKRLWNEVKHWEGKLAQALAEHDSDAATVANERLRTLRQELRHLSA